MIPNELTNDPNLSAKAKGVYNYLKSKPESWKFYITEIVENFTDGKEAIYSAIKELINEGWLVRKEERERGKFASVSYIVLTEKAKTVTGLTVTGLTANGKAVNGLTGNGKPDTINTNNNNTEIIKTDNNNKQDVELFIEKFNSIEGVTKMSTSMNWVQTGKIQALLLEFEADYICEAIRNNKFWTGKKVYKGETYHIGYEQLIKGKLREVVANYKASSLNKKEEQIDLSKDSFENWKRKHMP